MFKNIYPPILESSQPAFVYNGEEATLYPIYFKLPSMMSLNSVEHIQIRIVQQSNNQTIVNTNIYPDGIIYKNISQVSDVGGTYAVSINSLEDLNYNKNWVPGNLYKVQIRFGTASINEWISNKIKFSDWKYTQMRNEAFSDWSNIMILKTISQPDIIINNAAGRHSHITSSYQIEANLTPIFYASCNIPAADKENINRYKFDIYKGQIDVPNEDELLESSGWLQYNTYEEVTSYRFRTALIEKEFYTVFYSIQTVNGYEGISAPYIFETVVDTLSEQMIPMKFEVESDSDYCRENGCINIYLTNLTEDILIGNYVITRSSEKDSYLYWDDLTFLFFKGTHFDSKQLVYQDFNIENGVKYKYAIQEQNSANLRTARLYEQVPAEQQLHEVNFDYSYLYADGIQLKLKYNTKISNFKHTILENKQDTLGSKYPIISRNGYANYAEFNISGLISFYTDNDELFFKHNADGYTYQDTLAIPQRKKPILDIEAKDSLGNLVTMQHDQVDTSSSDNNIFIEKVFREKVEAFLNNGEYKLFKSPTEGNFVVVLMNVTLTPEDTINRLVYNFSATAYEVAETTIAALDEYNIIKIGNFTNFTSDDNTLLFGQIHGLYKGRYSLDYINGERIVTTNTTFDNLYELIKQDNEYNISEKYRYAFKKLKSIWIEQYPKLTYEVEIKRILAEIQQQKTTGDVDKLHKLELELQTYQDLVAAIDAQTDNPMVTIEINNQEIMLNKNRVYSVDALPIYNTPNINLKYSGPIVLNYICEVYTVEDETQTTSSIEYSEIWGQLQGIFTNTPDILFKYNYKYALSDELQVYEYYGTDTILNLYKTLNILDVLKEKSKYQIETDYGTKFVTYDVDTETWSNNDTLYYNFNNVTMLEIEAEPGTAIKIISADGEEHITKVGATGKYVLNPIPIPKGDIYTDQVLIKDICFLEPTYAIINYKCSTSQITKKASAGGQ